MKTMVWLIVAFGLALALADEQPASLDKSTEGGAAGGGQEGPEHVELPDYLKDPSDP